MKRSLKKEKAADFVIGHKICCMQGYIERRSRTLPDTVKVAFLKKK